MATETSWDVRVVNLASDSLTVISHVPNWNALQFGDMLNSPGHGSLEVDFDETWLSDFYSANSAYPWEGNYGLQVLRSGQLVFTFIIEEAEIEYAGARRRVVMGGRGIIACLQWAVVLPDGWDESSGDPDGLVDYVNRGFGDSHSDTAELDAGTYSVDSPKYKAYGGGAFVYLFNEADTGSAQTWQETVAGTTADIVTGTASRNSNGVSWPLSLKSGTTVTTDSAGTAWNATGTYPSADVTWLFEVPSGQTMLDTLEQCADLQAQAQWMVSPSGEISLAKSVGVDKTGTILLTVPNAVRSANAFRRTDLRSHMIGSNGWVFEHQTDSAATTIYGRREGFVGHDNAHGEGNVEATKAALNDVKDPLDEFTFQYVETDATQAWLDFTVGDKVRIEYEPGTVQARQVVGLSASLSPTSSSVEVTIGDVVSNIIARLEKKEDSEQYSDQITQKRVTSNAKPNPPTNLSVTPDKEGLSRRATLSFNQPAGWESEIAHYEAEVYNSAASSQKYRLSRPVQRGSSGQTMDINGFGTKGGTYKAKVRAVSKLGHISDPSTEATFTMLALGEGTSSDPDKPNQISGVSLFGMLNAVLVKFNDLNSGSNVTISGNRGKYEIQVSNATGGSANWTSGNVWTRTIGGNTSGDTSAAARQAFVPTGDGFIIPGLLSTSGGRTHYVRVRGINWDGTEGDWSSTVSVSLDADDESQVGVWIGEDTIHASHIKAGTITATEILTGTITASEVSANEIFAASIQLPPPLSGATSAGDTATVRAFTIDHDGNMWWGNYTSFTAAVTGNDNPRFKADGTDFFVGGSTNSMHWDGSELEIKGKLTAGQVDIGSGNNSFHVNTSGDIWSGHATEASAPFQVDNQGNLIAKSVTLGDQTYGASAVMGGSGKVRIRVDTTDYSPWLTTTALEWLSSTLSTTYGSVVGGQMSIGGAGGLRLQAGSGSSNNYVEVRNAPSSGTIEGVRIWAATANADDIMVVAGGDLSLIGGSSNTIFLGTSASGSHVQVPRNGIELVTHTPAITTNKLYNVSGTLHWDGDPVGGSYTWDLSANYATTSSAVTVNDGDRVDFTHVASSGISVSRPAGTTIRTALDINGMTNVVTLDQSDRVAIYDTSLGAHRYATVQEITDLGSYSWNVSASGGASTEITDGETLDFTKVGNAGLDVTRAGNTITTKLDINGMTNVTAAATDKIAIWDVDVGAHRNVTAQSIADLGGGSYSWTMSANGGTTTEITDAENVDFDNLGTAGILVSRIGNTVRTALDVNAMTATTPVAADKLAIYDTSATAHRSITIQQILDLGGGGDITYVGATTSAGLTSTNPGGPIPMLGLDVFNNLSTTTPATGDWMPLYDISTGLHKRATAQQIANTASSFLPLSGGTMSGSINFSSGNWIQGSTGGGMVVTGGSGQSGWLRGNGGGQGGVEATGSQTNLYHGASNVCQTYTYGLLVSAGSLGLGSSNNYRLTYSTANSGSVVVVANGAAKGYFHSGGVQLIIPSTATWGGYITRSGWDLQIYTSMAAHKDIIKTVPSDEALGRLKALRPVEFTFKQSKIGDGTNEYAPFTLNRGFIAEEVAAVDHWMASWGWVDPETDQEIPHEEGMSLDDTVPVNYSDKAIIADLVAVVQSLEARLAALET